MFRQFPNLVFFFLGWSLLALPCYLLTAMPQEGVQASDIIFPVVLSVVFLLLTFVILSRLRAPLRATQAMTAAAERGGLQAPIILPAHSSATVVTSSSWVDALGFRVSSVGGLAVVEVSALVFATLGHIGIGWAAGLTTLCAYNKNNDIPATTGIHWQECYQFSRGWHSKGEHSQTGLPTTYFGLLLTSLIITVSGPFLWFVLYKVVRQAMRPAKHEKTDDGLRELPQTAMFALAAMVGIIAGAGAPERLPVFSFATPPSSPPPPHPSVPSSYVSARPRAAADVIRASR